MCGIAGIIGDSAADQAVLAAMGGSLQHRGPDDQGVWIDGEAGVGLVHRRLAIVDLSAAGHQPMLSSDGRFVLSFNGEIYNHAEIRAELEERGLTPAAGWRGHSDTETLLEAVLHWGLEPTLERCVGMFAISLWDRRERRLFLVRDRFGEKPLYYGWAGRDFVFGSELKAIRCHSRFEAQVDRSALRLFASRDYIPAPFSIYLGIFKLEPGCILSLDIAAARTPRLEPFVEGQSGTGAALTRYWSYREVVRAGLADLITQESEALEALDAALRQSIEGQSLADVPVGAFLSGGIDSSTVVALYQKYSGQAVRTFTIGFAEATHNEADDARAVAMALGTRHEERLLTAREAQEVIPKLPQLYDEPFADSSQIPTHVVSAFAREQVTVALSGDGGDELFGGYQRYFGTVRVWSKSKRLPRLLRSVAGGALAAVPAGAWARAGAALAGGKVSPEFGDKVRRTFRTIADASGLEDVVARFLEQWPEGSPVLGVGESAALPIDLDVGLGAPDAARMMYYDAVSYLPDDILCKVDRAAMGVGLETRVPFLDHRVAALAARIPLSLKIRGGSGKHILRKLLYQQAPKALFERPKAGFGVPVGEWIKGPLRGWAEELLDPRQLRADGWFDPDLVTRSWRAHLAGTRDCTAALWGILMFQAWQKDQKFAAAVAA